MNNQSRPKLIDLRFCRSALHLNLVGYGSEFTHKLVISYVYALKSLHFKHRDECKGNFFSRERGMCRTSHIKSRSSGFRVGEISRDRLAPCSTTFGKFNKAPNLARAVVPTSAIGYPLFLTPAIQRGLRRSFSSRPGNHIW